MKEIEVHHTRGAESIAATAAVSRPSAMLFENREDEKQNSVTHRVAGTQRHIDFVRHWSESFARGRNEVVRGRGARRQVAAPRRLLAHEVS